ncbi:MAG: lipoate--protein ligase family protein [Planctomycetes bacterium]|nr:lipoate--protein ligase family protein [Planctomycetota bacterium]
MSHDNYIRVISDPPLDGPSNMARDEALMTRVGCAKSPPTLRLYAWAPPTISLGYFQHYADFERLDEPAGSLAVVRRLTGGGAILHDLELTYSLSLPTGHALLADGPNELYVAAHDAVIASLAELDVAGAPGGFTDDSGAAKGPFFCFERRHALDVLVGNNKIAGSAQRRTKDATLQHGSIILGNRFDQQQTATPAVDFATALERLRGLFVKHFAARTGQTLIDGEWDNAEHTDADALRPKYAGNEWTRRA